MNVGDERAALDAAVALLSSFGQDRCTPIVLQSSNNVVARLDPYPTVVKVAGRQEKRDALRIELALALHLARSDAPTVRPVTGIPAIVHEHDGSAMTFWGLVPVVMERSPDGGIGASLARVHHTLLDFEDDLPGWRNHLNEVIRRLHEPVFPASDADTKVLRAAATRIEMAVEGFGEMQEQPLIGEPHLDNVLAGPNGWVFCDFEAACTGPVESELAYLPLNVIKTYGPYDEELRDLFVRITNLRVATWCWIGAGQSAELRQHAEHHTSELARWLRQ